MRAKELAANGSGVKKTSVHACDDHDWMDGHARHALGKSGPGGRHLKISHGDAMQQQLV